MASALRPCPETSARTVESTMGAATGVYDGSGEAASAPLGGGQSVCDEVGAHVSGDRRVDQAARSKVDDRRRVVQLPVLQREIGEVADVHRVRLGHGEAAADRVRGLRPRRVRDRGAMPATQSYVCKADTPHDARDPPAVDALASIAELGGDPGNTAGAVRFTMQDSYPGGEPGNSRPPASPGRSCPAPAAVAGAGDAEDAAQPLHAVAALVVGDDLYAVQKPSMNDCRFRHNFVAPHGRWDGMAVADETLSILDAKFAVLPPHLDERQRLPYPASEAEVLGHGGIAVVAAGRGLRVDDLAWAGRVRRRGRAAGSGTRTRRWTQPGSRACHSRPCSGPGMLLRAGRRTPTTYADE